MANLPEKNITTVDKITSIPSNTNLYINANGEFRQATVDDVLKSSPAIADSIANQYKNASGSPLLLTDSAKGVAIDFDVKGRSTQDGEPTPTEPITPKSNGDMGYFDGELLQGGRSTDNGAHNSGTAYVVTSKNKIPCKQGDIVTIHTDDNPQFLAIVYFNGDTFVNANYEKNVNESSFTVPSGVDSFHFNVQMASTETITPQTAKHIGVTINGKYALIVDSNNDRKYIPISAPLRGIGEVTDVASLSECEVDRKFTKLVFDGSDDEGWTLSTNRPSIGIADIKQTVEPIAICTHFKNVKYGTNVGEFFNFSNGYIYFVVSKELQSLNDWRTWLQANPITVIYELAEPTTESIEPIEIVTYDNVTQISVSDDADMEIEYPTSKVAGIASIGWSKGRRAEYDLEQLKAQMLALQTTIVSTV